MKFKRIVAAICAAAMAFSPAGVNVMSFTSFAETSIVETVTSETENDENDENGGQSDGSDGSENDENGSQDDGSDGSENDENGSQDDGSDESDESENDESDGQDDETTSDTSDDDVTGETTDEDVTEVSEENDVLASAEKYTLSYGATSVNYETWADVLAAMNSSSTDYTITLLSGATEGEITFPDETQAKSVTIVGEGDYPRTLTISNTELTLPIDVKFQNLMIESTDKTNGLTITVNKELSALGLRSNTLKKVSGGDSDSVFKYLDDGDSDAKYIEYEISDIGTLDIDESLFFVNTVNATKLKLENNATIFMGSKAVIFTSIEAGSGSNIIYIDEGFDYPIIPITVNESITLTSKDPITFSCKDRSDLYNDTKSIFPSGTTVLISEKADISKVTVDKDCLPTEDSILAREGSEVKIKSAVFELSSNGSAPVKYSSWAEAVAEIKDSSKDYTITLLCDMTDGEITFPNATQAKSVTVDGGGHDFTIANTELTLPIDVTLKNINFGSSDKTNGLTIVVNKSLTALKLNEYKKNLKKVTGNSDSVINYIGVESDYQDVDGMFEYERAAYDITGIGTINVSYKTLFSNPVNAGKLNLADDATIYITYNYDIPDKEVIFTDIEAGSNGNIAYTGISSVTVTGSITSKDPITLSYVSIFNINSTYEFTNGVTLLKCESANVSDFTVNEDSLPDGGVLVKEGSEFKIRCAVYSYFHERDAHYHRR